MRPSRERHDLPKRTGERPVGGRGLSMVELLLALTIMMVGILGIIGMFSTGYTNIAEGGRMTLAIAGARQILEDLRTLPFASIGNLNGFDTGSAGTLPAANPERDIARKWRYALAGDGTGWNFTVAEKQQWKVLASEGVTFGGSGQISVVAQGATMWLVTVTVSVPGRTVNVSLSTLFSRM